MKKFAKKLLITLGVIAFWFCAWVIAAKIIDKPILFPSPLDVVKRLGELIVTLGFWQTALISIARIVYGIALAMVLGIALALISSLSRIISAVLDPLVIAIKSTPVASFIVLLLIWLDRDIISVVITVMIAMPVIYTNIKAGLSKVDEGHLRLAKIYDFSPWKRARRIYIPTAMPFFISACRLTIGLSWKAGIAAEVLARPAKAIGTELYDAKMYLEMTDLMAWTLVVIILSIILEAAIVKLFSALGKKYSFDGGAKEESV